MFDSIYVYIPDYEYQPAVSDTTQVQSFCN